MMASGGYERPLLAALCKAALPARRVNPARLRQFARAAGVPARNDRLDAMVIARFCAVMPQREARHDPLVAELAEPVTTRRQARARRTMRKLVTTLDAILRDNKRWQTA